jgi:galactonate dehydratase
MLDHLNQVQRHKRARLAGLAAAAAAPAAKPALAIADLAAVAVREPASRRTFLLLTVRAEGGAIGIGETRIDADSQPVIAAVGDLRRDLVGQDALAVERLCHRLSATIGTRHPGLLAAINMALLDILGKQCRSPLAEVLGGPTRTRVRVVANLQDTAAERFPDAIRPLVEAGWRAFRVPLPLGEGVRGPAFARRTLEYLERIRQAVGPSVDLILDCQGQLAPREAAALARTIERFHVLFLDDPVSEPSASNLQKIAEESVVPLGFGRAETSVSRFQELLRAQAIDVPRPSFSRLPIGAIRKLAALAETHYVAIAPVHDAGPVSTAAALQVAASLPNFFIQEIPVPADDRDRQMRRELLTTAVETPADGFLPLPARPGLGIELNDEAIRKYQVR